MKMAELVKRTGVEKQAIHFYINKGLLPRPLKAKKNVAFYDESYVERIKLIKELQLKRFLPLDVIKEIINRTDGDLSVSEIDVIRTSGKEPGRIIDIGLHPGPLTAAELSEHTGLSPKDIEEMDLCEMISSTLDTSGEKIYDEVDVGIAAAFSEIRQGGLTEENGISVEDLRLQSDIINMLAIEEVKLFARKFADRFPEYGEDLLLQMAESAVKTIEVFIARLRRKKILETIRGVAADGREALDRMDHEDSEKESTK